MNDPVREQVIKLLRGGQAHLTLDDVIKDFPQKLRGVKPDGAPHTAWQLLEHLRIAQSDILEFSRNAKHVSPPWPEGYWPKTEKPPSDAAWKKAVFALALGIGVNSMMFTIYNAAPFKSAIPILLASIVFIACLAPALRAARLNPVEALRTE